MKEKLDEVADSAGGGDPNRVRTTVGMTFGSVPPRRDAVGAWNLRELAMEEMAENALQEGKADVAPEG